MNIKQFDSKDLLYMAEQNQADPKLLQAARNTHIYKRYTDQSEKYLMPFCEGLTGASIPLDIFWGVIYLTNLGIMMMTGLIGALSIVAIVIGLGMAWKSHHKAKKEQSALNSQLANAICNEFIYKELLIRKQEKVIKNADSFIKKIFSLANEKQKTMIINLFERHKMDVFELINNKQQLLRFSTNHTLQSELLMLMTDDKRNSVKSLQQHTPHQQAKLKATNNRPKVIKAIISGVSITSLIFCSFFVFSSYLLLGLGFAAAAAVLSNPISIGIALLAAAGLGLYFGIKSFTQSKLRSEKKNIIHLKTQEIDNLKSRLHYTQQINRRMKKLDVRISDHVAAEQYDYLFFNKPSRQMNEIARNENISINTKPQELDFSPRFCK